MRRKGNFFYFLNLNNFRKACLLEVDADWKQYRHINVCIVSKLSQPHSVWAMGVSRQGRLLELGVFLLTPHTVCPHAFVSGPSFWVAAATGTRLEHSLF